MKKRSPASISLIELLNQHGSLSGAALSEALGISGDAVHKEINHLVKRGVPIEFLQSEGYCLHDPLIMLNAKKLKKAIQAFCPASQWKLEIFETLSSTNDYLKIHHDPKRKRVCLAEEQTVGRGRFNRPWVSPFSQNIYLSCSLPFHQDLSDLGGLGLVVGLALKAAFHACGIDALLVKWPNDILWQGKKLAGILLEMVAESHGVTQVIIGMGINVNMQHADQTDIQRDWVSMREILNEYQDRNVIAGEVLKQVMHYLNLFMANGFSYFQKEWKKVDALFGQPIQLSKADEKIKGIAMGVNAQGHLLLLQSNDNTLHAYSAGEVTIAK